MQTQIMGRVLTAKNGQIDNPTMATLNRYAQALGQRLLVRLVDSAEQ